MSQRPLIGITGFETAYPKPPHAPLYATGQRYVRAVEDAGGLPVILSPGLSNESLLAVFERLDGLLLSGGGDIDPTIYGEEPHPTIWGLDMNRDRAELAVAQWAAETQKPLLCICRLAAGIQAALGGLLVLFITACALQLLLALLDNMLRREWMRYVAALSLTGTLLAVNVTMRRTSDRLAEETQKAGYSPARLLADVRTLLDHVPTVAAPASVGGAHVSGALDAQWLALAVSLAALLLPLWLGARVMSRAVTREGLAGRVRTRGGRAASGSFAARWPGLTPPQALLVNRQNQRFPFSGKLLSALPQHSLPFTGLP